MENVIKGCKNHQHDDDCQANPEPDLLRPLGQRPAADCFDSIEQKVTAIEERDREQVQKDRSRTDNTAVRWMSATKPALATWPET